MQQGIKMNLSRKAFLAVFIIPTLILYLVFGVYPIFESIRVSFYKWSGFSNVMKYIGLDNYKEILSDEIFGKAIFNDFFIIFWKEIIIVFLSVFFAVALTRLKFSKGETAFYRFVFYIPNVLSVIVIALLWSFIYHPSIGILNSVLKSLGLESLTHAWLGEMETALPSIVPVASWAGIGFFMIIIIAAIGNVPSELYESANIDGAGEMTQLFKITLPLIWDHLKFTFITILLTSLASNYVLVQPITNGGPNNATQVMGLYVYQMGLQQYRVGFAYAASVVLMFVTAVVSLISNRLLYKDSYLGQG